MKYTILLISLISIGLKSKAQSLPAYLPTLNLEAWYPFENSYNDMSGNNNNATNFGTTFVEDRCGNTNNAVYFNGNYQKLVVQNNILPATPTSFSIAFWVKRNASIGPPKEIINDRGNVTWNYKYRVQLGSPISPYPNNYSHALLTYINGIGYEEFSVDSPTTPNWEHVVMVYDRDLLTQYIYSNGQQIATKVIAQEFYPHQTTSTHIGYSTAPGTNNDHSFEGTLDDIGIWSRALNVKEIISLYKGLCNTVDTSTSLRNEIYQNNEIDVYPNPASNSINVNFKSYNNNTYQIKIINNLGQTIYQKDHNAKTTNIDLSAQSAGVYYIYLIDHKNVLKSIKEIILQ